MYTQGRVAQLQSTIGRGLPTRTGLHDETLWVRKQAVTRRDKVDESEIRIILREHSLGFQQRARNVPAAEPSHRPERRLGRVPLGISGAALFLARYIHLAVWLVTTLHAHSLKVRRLVML